jgi:hypothetical protein
MTYPTFPNYYIKWCCLHQATGHQSSWPVRCERPESHKLSSIRHINEAHVGKLVTVDRDLSIKELWTDRDESILFCNFSKNKRHRSCNLLHGVKNVIYLTELHHLQSPYSSFLQRTYQDDDFFTSSEDSLLGHHRNRAAISATSFIGGSTDSTIANIHKHHNCKCSNSRMSASTQKELNLFITTPEVPDLSTEDDTSKHKVTVQEPLIQENNHVCGIICEDTCACKDNAEQSVMSKAEIRWGPQVSSC